MLDLNNVSFTERQMPHGITEVLATISIHASYCVSDMEISMANSQMIKKEVRNHLRQSMWRHVYGDIEKASGELLYEIDKAAIHLRATEQREIQNKVDNLRAYLKSP